jgi:ribosomal protein S1
MSDQTRPEAPSEDFAAMLAASERQEGGGRGRRPRIGVGDRVRGTVLSVGREVTVVELAGGGEGTLETLELHDENGELTVAVGDSLEARVVAIGEKAGIVSLRRGA